ncbi:M12 family metallo-peptidase [Pseudomarimonas salicorniae]|uniref:Zinc-dependent metalloprotease n=1 Tax=Pseudomarimonas salicorniae TaxID=2933270 RepID=A0ABT0GJQ7_9GAMM|nr:M12 family metallo-peptidase [Lysobacter sp. CAU 1642]MCK7594776.1 zinc-dependent metalloprotease [Lysobacter sp. CAU 1642]
MRSVLAAALAAALLCPLDPALAAGNTDIRFDGEDLVSAAEIQDWRANPANRSIRAFHLDRGQLSKRGGSISLQLAPGLSLDVTEVRSRRDESGLLIWEGLLTDLARTGKSGEVAFDPMNSVTLVDNHGKLTGSVRVDGQLYKIRPLSSGGHAIIEFDETLVPADHPEGVHVPDGPLAGALARGELQGDSAKANTTIRVMSVATTAAKNAAGDIVGLVNLSITEANQSYANSGISITLQSAGVYTASYTESGSFSTDLARIRGTTDGYLDSVHSLRNQQTADVVMFFINNSSSCGLASAIGASATTAFAAVHWDCATGYYSFGHEIGHLQAARHDPANDPSTTPYAYGHGYQAPSKAWRTVMAYACTGGCPRINYWSNPNRTYGGVAMGTAATHDNARVLNNTRASIAAFR